MSQVRILSPRPSPRGCLAAGGPLALAPPPHIDEVPAAYKPIDEVMANQRDLVGVVHTLKQVLVCVKG